MMCSFPAIELVKTGMGQKAGGLNFTPHTSYFTVHTSYFLSTPTVGRLLMGYAQSTIFMLHLSHTHA